MNNLASNPDYADLVSELDQHLYRLLDDIGDDFRPAQSYVDEWGLVLAPHGSIPYTNDSDAGPQSPQTPQRQVKGE